MSIEPSTIPVKDAQKLARFLRAHPEATDMPPEQLADRFTLPVEFVESVLESLGSPRERSAVASLRPAWQWSRRLFHQIRLAFRRLTADPTAFIGVTTALSIALFLVINYRFGGTPGLVQGTPQGSFVLSIRGSEIPFAIIALTTLLTHLAAYFRHGMVRHALVGALMAWVISSGALITLAWLQFRNQTEGEFWLVAALLSFLMLFLCGVYAGLGATVSVIGGVVWVRREEREREQRSRQELIEHLFDLQQRLNQPETQTDDDENLWHQFMDRVRASLLPMSVALGFGLSALDLGVTIAFVRASGSGSFEDRPLFLLFWICLRFLNVVLMAAVAFSARRLLPAIFYAIVFQLSTIPMYLVPVAPYGWERFQMAVSPTSLSLMVLVAVITAVLATLGAKVEAEATMRRQLKANDKAALLAEIVKTEWQLELQSRSVCVLVVDVARSSQMKAQANPLEVEYSFREYQRYVKETCAMFEGRVHSTAGDGAVVAFDNCLNAFEAARRIHAGLPEFNTRRNKLSTEFRVRIGLHVGPVAGDLNDVQFAEVIDIAAHVEASAPIGGIAVTQPVAEQLPGARLVPQNERVSGLPIFVALNPGLDESFGAF